MRLAKHAASIAALALGLTSVSCQSPRYEREFPPRVDRYLADELSRGARGLAETGARIYESTKKDLSSTCSNLTQGLPSYLGNELWNKPREMGSTLADMGSREWKRTNELPGAIWDFFELLVGI